MSDLAKLDPSLNIQAYGPAEERIIIRGVSSVVGATTGVYLDETPLQGGFNSDIPGDNTPTLGLRDIDHVEVLKGPQGTLFGAGSMDGTVRVITNQPNLETFGGWVRGQAAGREPRRRALRRRRRVNIPSSATRWRMRLNVWGDDGGGYINQIISGHTLDHVNDTEQWGVRGQLLGAERPLLDCWRRRQLPAHAWSTAASTRRRFIGGLVNAPFSPYIGPNPQWTNQQPSQEPYYQDFQLYSLTAKYDLGFGQVIENSSYGYKDEFDANDTSPQDCSYNLCEGTGAFVPALYTAHPSYWYTLTTSASRPDVQGAVPVRGGRLLRARPHQLRRLGHERGTAGSGLAPCDLPEPVRARRPGSARPERRIPVRVRRHHAQQRSPVREQRAPDHRPSRVLHARRLERSRRTRRRRSASATSTPTWRTSSSPSRTSHPA